MAAGLRVPKALGDFLILADLYASHGDAVAASDEASMAACRDMARLEGIFGSPEGGAGLVAIQRLAEQGKIAAPRIRRAIQHGRRVQVLEAWQAAWPCNVERRTLHTLAGPAVFLLLVLTPLPSMSYPVRASIGLLVWMSWWWIAQPVHLAVTAFLPLVVTALFDILPVGAILPAYAEQLIFLLLGANILATLWRRWGLDRRIALLSLLGIGTSTRRQILAWFLSPPS